MEKDSNDMIERSIKRSKQFTLDQKPETHDILEIGALNRPTFDPHQERVKFADYLPQEDLIKKFQCYEGFDTTKIVHVDYVVHGYDFERAVGDNRFDLILASHVIEHVPNPLGWLEQLACILKPRGVISLIVPDKRFCFDVLRSTTTWTDLITYHLLSCDRPDVRRILDHLGNCVTVSTEELWNGSIDPKKITPIHSLPHAYQLAKQLSLSKEYFDIHCSVFTPRSFLTILSSVYHICWPNLLLNTFFETIPGEMDFFVSFVKLPDDTDRTLIAAENVNRTTAFMESLRFEVGSQQ